MPLAIDVFWSFRSPYSYLATPRLVALAAEYDLDVHVRPVLPIAVRIPGFFATVNPLWPPYLLRDTMRIAQHLGIDYGWPRPDPIVQDYATRQVAAEQPYIHRLTRLGVAAARARTRSRRSSRRCRRSSGTAKSPVGTKARTSPTRRARAGLDLAELDAIVSRDAARFDAAIAKNQEDHLAAGHWGVPTMVFQGEPFFGQDRLDLLVWRLEQHGLSKR